MEKEYEMEDLENIGLESVCAHIEHIYNQLGNVFNDLSGAEQRNKALKKVGDFLSNIS